MSHGTCQTFSSVDLQSTIDRDFHPFQCFQTIRFKIPAHFKRKLMEIQLRKRIAEKYDYIHTNISMYRRVTHLEHHVMISPESKNL